MSVSERINRLRTRLGELWDEAEYGRKRMLEVRTGHVYTEETRRRLARAEIEELKALYDVDAVGCLPDEERDPLDAPRDPLSAPYEDRRDDRPRLE